MRLVRIALSATASLLACTLAVALAHAANGPSRNPPNAPPTNATPTTTPAAGAGGAAMQIYPSKYYLLHTDVSPEDARETVLRMVKMFECYHKRTSGFCGETQAKFPFYFYAKPEDYQASGTPAGSGGVFIRDQSGGRLMAIAGEHPSTQAWHTVQHEGFHQFAAAVIRGDLPPWINEGLAEYFGEAVFTGDDFVTGLIPMERAARVKKEITDKKFKPFKEMMILTPKEWIAQMSQANYDQGWAMVHFLAHGADGKYQKGLVQFMNNIGQGQTYFAAWVSVFGPDVAKFQSEFETWWSALPEQPTQTLYQKAELATLASFLARADSNGKHFANAAEFFAAASRGELVPKDEDWLPPTLLKNTIKRVEPVEEEFVLQNIRGQGARLMRTIEGGKKLVGTYVLGTARVRSVTVEESAEPKK